MFKFIARQADVMYKLRVTDWQESEFFFTLLVDLEIKEIIRFCYSKLPGTVKNISEIYISNTGRIFNQCSVGPLFYD